MRKNPEVNLKLKYKKVIELSMILSLVILNHQSIRPLIWVNGPMIKYTPFIKASSPNMRDNQNIWVQIKAPAIKIIPKIMGKIASILTFSIKKTFFKTLIVFSV